MSVGAISRFVLAHKRLVVAFWIITTIVAAVTVSSAVGALSEDFSVPGGDGSAANGAISDTFGNGGSIPPLVPVIALPDGTTVDSPGVKEEIAAIFAEIQQAAPAVRTVSFAADGDRAFVSEDGATTFGLIYVPIGTGFNEAPEVELVKEVLSGATVAGVPVGLTGYTELETGGDGGEGESVLVQTLVGGVGALIILAWVFGSFLAFVPLIIAIVSILTTFLVIWGLTAFADVSFIVQFLVALIGLGVAIDYALLIVTRWREERAAGYENEEAVQRAMETAGTAVVFSGTTVAIGLLALVVLPVPFLRSVGYGGMLIPLVSVIVSITLLPVFLAKLGPRFDWPRLRKGTQESRFWTAWARGVVRYRWIAAASALAILAVLIYPVFSIVIGEPTVDSLAKSGAPRVALDKLEDAGIGSGVLQPFEVIATDSDPAAAAQALAGADDVRAAVAPSGAAWRTGDQAMVAVMPNSDAGSSDTDALESVRSIAGDLPGSVQVGGTAAENADFLDAIYGSFPLMVALISIVTFILLVRAFRSVLLPLKAIVLNFLSVAAAFGIMVYVWQQGNGSEILGGGEPTGAIIAFIPLMVFAFLFGLSMDYEVFILARMREEYDISGETDDAIIKGIGATGRLVTSAALILFLAFVALGMSGPEVFLKVFATGLAAGILLDATVIRSLLVPATVSLFGKWNWWLPTWLERFVSHPTPLHVQAPTVTPSPAQGD